MNLRAVLLVLSSLTAVAAFAAEPLVRDATVYAQPEPGAKVLKVLPAGTTPEPAPASAVAAPEGWLAVQVTGTFDLFIENKDQGKELNIRPGAPLYFEPNHNAPAIGVMEAGDKAELVGLRGGWTLYKVERPLVGYLKLAMTGTVAAAAPLAPAIGAGDTGKAGLPRFYEGRFAATRGFLGFKHPYNFQLLDPAGNRFAYLDVSRLLITDTLDHYFDRLVIVFGTARRLEGEGKKGVVIEVESLHLK